MPKRILVVVALLAIAAAGWAGWRAWQRRSAADGLLLAGTLEARSVEVGSLLGGRVAAVHVAEGDTVAANAPLVTLESDLIELQVAEQKARIGEAAAVLERARRGPRGEELARARIALAAAQTERRRQQALLRDGVIGQREFDRAAVAESTAAETHRELQRGTRAEDVAAAEAALAAANARLAYLERQRAESVVAAPANGVVQTLDLRPGDLVAPNQPVASLLEQGQLWVRVYVPEPKLGLVRLGQRAAVTVDTFPEREFPGRVVEIRGQAEYTPRNVQTLDQRNDQVFGVKIELEQADELRAGMAVVARLDLAGPADDGAGNGAAQ